MRPEIRTRIECLGNQAAEGADPDATELAVRALAGDEHAITEALEVWWLWQNVPPSGAAGFERIASEWTNGPLLLSQRGHVLLRYTGTLPGKPVLTVELWGKWHELFLITWIQREQRLDGVVGKDVYQVHFGHLEPYAPEGSSAYVDHVPNPVAVRRFCIVNGYELDELADELIEGRWQIEVARQAGGKP